MTLRTNKLTPKALIGAPRRSSGTPCADGTLALYTQSTYSFETHSKTSGIYVLDVNSGESELLTNDPRASEPRWLGLGCEIIWLKAGENGNTSFVIADANDVGKTYAAATISGPVSNLKIHVVEENKIIIAFSGKSNRDAPDGSLYNPKDVGKPHSSGRIYDSLFVRHWDAYVQPERNTVWTAFLQKSPSNVTARNGRWSLLGVTNMLKHLPFLECPIPPFGGTDHFDITNDLIAIVSKAPNLNPATHTACVIYVLRIPNPLSVEEGIPEPTTIKPEGKSTWGAATSAVFSPDGNNLAYLLMDKDGYESDQNQIHVAHLGGESVIFSQALDVQHSDGKWDRSPSSVMFSADGNKLLVIAEDTGFVCLFELDLTGWLSSGSTTANLRRLTTPPGSISDIAYASLLSPKLFISSSTLTDSSLYYILDPSDPNLTRHEISSLTNHGASFGLSPSQVSSIWWPGANSHPIHAFMLTPSFFKPTQKYPLALLIHGGPQGAWNDAWSTRWNPALFAEQGYIVVTPNPTGSTGYGQAFTDAIRNQWGGLPYLDLTALFTHLETHFPTHLDTTRAVALGASYGGYMINWLQGHALGRKFLALVCHDGVFSMSGQLASDEQYFPLHDLGGPIWEHNQAGFDRWDPSRFTQHWATPQLVIHNERDYRLTIAEGLAAFNVLQMRGVPSRFLSFPDENHWVLGHENSLLWHTVVVDWINGWVGLEGAGDVEARREVQRCRMDAAVATAVDVTDAEGMRESRPAGGTFAVQPE